MTDRELLELAAKAAGIGDEQGRTIWTESEYPHGSGNRGALWNGRGYMDTAELWNPLTDDGDALRLAVKLRMCVLLSNEKDDAAVTSDNGCAKVKFSADPYAATRLAIVRAAAEIGKDMP